MSRRTQIHALAEAMCDQLNMDMEPAALVIANDVAMRLFMFGYRIERIEGLDEPVPRRRPFPEYDPDTSGYCGA